MCFPMQKDDLMVPYTEIKERTEINVWVLFFFFFYFHLKKRKINIQVLSVGEKLQCRCFVHGVSQCINLQMYNTVHGLNTVG